jgi:glycosyltransferase involved in cell wall biosynthesis
VRGTVRLKADLESRAQGGGIVRPVTPRVDLGADSCGRIAHRNVSHSFSGPDNGGTSVSDVEFRSPMRAGTDRGTQKKLSVLYIGPTPPPYHGVTVLNETLLRSRFVDDFDVVSIRTNYASRISELGKFSLFKVWRLLGYELEILRALLSRSFDFVCFPINFSSRALVRDLFLLSCVSLFRPKIVFYVHGNCLPEFRADSSRLMQKIIDFSMRLADAGIVSGDSLRFNLEPYLPPDRILTVPPGVEVFDAECPEKRKPSHIQILFLSNLSFGKGVDTVIEAIPKVIAKRQDVRFVIAGEWFDRNEAEQIAEFIAKHGIDTFIEWRGLATGFKKEQLYLSSDIFVFPTAYCYESFGIVNLEAMQAGLPIITTARGEIPQLVRHGINGFIIPEQNPAALADSILQLCADEKLREQMGRNNREKFLREYTMDQYVDRMIAAFDHLHEAWSPSSI